MMISKTYQKRYLFLLLVATVGFSCGKESSCFKSTGNNTTELRNISNEVTVITLEDKINLVLTQGNVASLTVEGGKNMLPYINTDLNGNELKISSDNKCNFLRDYGKSITVYLSLPSITKVNYTGQGVISSTNTLVVSDFEYESRNGTGSVNLNVIANNISITQHNGPADVTISGSANNLYTYSGENGWLYLNSLRANSVHVNNSGTGDIIVHAVNSLLVELTSIGNIDYYGNPSVTVSMHTGGGQIRKK